MDRSRLGRRQESNANRSFNVSKWYEAPENVENYKIQKGENIGDILPFTYGTDLFKTAANPNDKAVKGDLDYVLVVNVHKNIGVNDTDIICPKQFGLPCPICNEIQKMRDDGKQYDDFKDIAYSTRVLYNFRSLSGEQKDVITLWEGSYKWIEKELQKKADRERSKLGEVIWADYETGYNISFYGEKESYGKVPYLKPTDFQFEKRDNQPGEKVLDETIKLDTLVSVMKYEDIEAIFFGQEVVESEPEKEEPKREREVVKEEPVQERVRERKVEKEEVVEESVEDKCSQGLNLGTDFDSSRACNKCPEDEYNSCRRVSRGI